MESRDIKQIVIALVLATVFTIYCIDYNKKEPQVTYDNRVPPCPTTGTPGHAWQWDFYSRTWKEIKVPDTGRANAISKPALDKDDIIRHLEKTIPGYEEDTYWGEEWNTGQEPPD